MLVPPKSGIAFHVGPDASERCLVLAGTLDSTVLEIRITQQTDEDVINIRAYDTEVVGGTPRRVSLGNFIGGSGDLEELKAEYDSHFMVPEGTKFVASSAPGTLASRNAEPCGSREGPENLRELTDDRLAEVALRAIFLSVRLP